MQDDTALRRQWILLRTLSSRRNGLNIREMSAESGVTDRTIRRDLDLFRSLGFPVEEETGDFGRKTWRMRRESVGPPLAFSTDEAAALFLCRRLLQPLAGTFLWEAVNNALGKVRATLSPLALEYLSNFDRLLFCTQPGSHDYSPRAEIIDSLNVALEDCKCVRILYRSDRSPEPSLREVHPYGLIKHNGALYLVALDPSAERVKHYKVDRIDGAEVCATSFRMIPDFVLETYLSTTFGVYQSDGEKTTVRIQFASDVAKFVKESRWHASQSLVSLPDGGLIAEFTLTSTVEIKTWVLGFGRKAVVLEPEILRREVIEDLRQLLVKYEEA